MKPPGGYLRFGAVVGVALLTALSCGDEDPCEQACSWLAHCGLAPRQELCEAQMSSGESCEAFLARVRDTYSCCSPDDCASGHCILYQCVECTPETQQQDCLPTQGCVSGHCRDNCFQDEDCGSWRSCRSKFCSEPVGTLCEGSSDCGGGSCETVDSQLRNVNGYCTIACLESDPDPCPPGYMCTGDYCRP